MRTITSTETEQTTSLASCFSLKDGDGIHVRHFSIIYRYGSASGCSSSHARRFQDITIPPRAVVTHATLELRPASLSEDTAALPRAVDLGVDVRTPGGGDDPESGFASPDHTANLSGLVLGCIEAESYRCIISLQHFQDLQDNQMDNQLAAFSRSARSPGG